MPYQPVDGVITPGDSVRVWRYLTLEKYLHLISTSTLHFTRVDLFQDKWEGVYSKKLAECVKKYHEKNPDSSLVQELNSAPRRSLANCWHKSHGESASMWLAYGTSNSSIAISSNIGRLKRCVENVEFSVAIGDVQYIDFDSQSFASWNILKSVFQKRLSFRHEEEVRLLISLVFLDGIKTNFVVHENGMVVLAKFVDVPVDLTTLIEDVYVSPLCERWVVDLVENITQKYCGDQIQVKPSALYDECPHLII